MSKKAQPAGLRGIWPALLTPLTEGLEIDFDLLARHARELIEAGCAGVTPFGTTGEGPSFSVDEHARQADCPDATSRLNG